jgi:hypothetical protein
MVIGRGALQLEKLRVIVRTWKDHWIVDGLGRPEGWVLAMSRRKISKLLLNTDGREIGRELGSRGL